MIGHALAEPAQQLCPKVSEDTVGWPCGALLLELLDYLSTQLLTNL